jgi:hypothetical protein
MSLWILRSYSCETYSFLLDTVKAQWPRGRTCVGQIERLSRNRDDLHARVLLTVSEPIGNCRREVAASFPSPLVETMALSTCQIKDYLYQWCLQFLVRVCLNTTIFCVVLNILHLDIWRECLNQAQRSQRSL